MRCVSFLGTAQLLSPGIGHHFEPRFLFHYGFAQFSLHPAAATKNIASQIHDGTERHASGDVEMVSRLTWVGLALSPDVKWCRVSPQNLTHPMAPLSSERPRAPLHINLGTTDMQHAFVMFLIRLDILYVNKCDSRHCAVAGSANFCCQGQASKFLRLCEP